MNIITQNMKINAKNVKKTSHVAVVKNINNVVVNNAREPNKYKGLRVFSSIQNNCILTPKKAL